MKFESKTDCDSNENFVDVCIIGGGVSGLFLASKLALTELNVSIVESSNDVGGQINLYGDKYIYNIPLIEKIKGKDVCKYLLNVIRQKQNVNFCLNSVLKKIEKIGDDGKKFKLQIYNNVNKIYTEITCKYVVLAFGKGENVPNKLPLSNAEKFEGKSLFYHVDDKSFFAKKNVVIAGGGNSAIDWTVELKDIANAVTIVHRRNIEKIENDQFNSFKEFLMKNNITDSASDNDANISTIKTPYSIVELIGNENNGLIKEVKISNLETHTEEFIKCDYLLVFYGLKMMKSTFLDGSCGSKINIKCDNGGCVYVDRYTNETDEENIFAIGDCCSDNKIKNIQMNFAEATKCFCEICRNRELIY